MLAGGAGLAASMSGVADAQPVINGRDYVMMSHGVDSQALPHHHNYFESPDVQPPGNPLLPASPAPFMSDGQWDVFDGRFDMSPLGSVGGRANPNRVGDDVSVVGGRITPIPEPSTLGLLMGLGGLALLRRRRNGSS